MDDNVEHGVQEGIGMSCGCLLGLLAAALLAVLGLYLAGVFSGDPEPVTPIIPPVTQPQPPKVSF
jgi:hypothetical protein